MTSSAESALHQQLILTYAEAREGYGDPSALPLRSHQLNPTCGDEVTLGVRLDGDLIDEVRWNGRGCSISQASASLLTGLVVGTTAREAGLLIDRFREVMRSRGRLELDEERFGDAVALSGVSRYVARVKCAMLAWVALEQALARPDA